MAWRWDYWSSKAIIIHLRLVNDNLYEARADCENLTELSIPKSAELIDEGAFKSCINLSNIDILSNNIEIDDSAFSNCDKLVIHASEKSNAHRFAIKHNIPFIVTAV